MSEAFWGTVPAAPVLDPTNGDSVAEYPEELPPTPAHAVLSGHPEGDPAAGDPVPDPRTEHDARAAAYEAETAALTGYTRTPSPMPTFDQILDPPRTPPATKRPGIFRRKGR